MAAQTDIPVTVHVQRPERVIVSASLQHSVRPTTIIQTCVASPETHSTQRIQYPRFAVNAVVDHDAAYFGGILPPGGNSIACAAPPAYPVSARSVGPWSGIENPTIGRGRRAGAQWPALGGAK